MRIETKRPCKNVVHQMIVVVFVCSTLLPEGISVFFLGKLHLIFNSEKLISRPMIYVFMGCFTLIYLKEGVPVIDTEALSKVKRTLESNLGERVKLKANRGRKRCYIKEGVIHDIYPSIFTIRVNINERSVQTLSYTYSDVLTSNVELVVCKNNERI